MKRVANGDLWLPDDEEDKVMITGGAKYQSSKLAVALPYVKQARTAIDIGAHCGLWTVQLGQYFQQVECFEPLPRHIECWQKNAAWKLSCHLHEVALGAEERRVGMFVHERLSGRSHVEEGDAFEMRTLDSYGFEDVDLIKVDVEGYEYFVLKGGEQTILKNRPVMIVEQKPRHGGKYGLSDTAAVDYLKGLGATLKAEIVGDYVMVFE